MPLNNYVKKKASLLKGETIMKKLTVIDLFSGAGGYLKDFYKLIYLNLLLMLSGKNQWLIP